MKKHIQTAFDLFTTFFKIGAFTFGGGIAMLPILRKEVVEKRNWATDEQMLDYFAIGQSTPGVIATNVATFIGFKLLGFFGALLATCAIVLPSIIIITIIAITSHAIKDFAFISKILQGINVAVAVLLFSALIDLSKKTLVDIFTAVIALIAFIGMKVLSISALWIVLFAAVLGIIKKTLQAKNTEEV